MFRFILFTMLASQSLAIEPDWSDYNALLSAYVMPGTKDGLQANLVDYQGIAEDERFNRVILGIQQFDVSLLESREETLAFYINAYNILTIDLIIDHQPLESIRDIGNFFRGPWDIVVLENADGRLTLDDIEHEIIRSFAEPRIHFAVNCASLSCPDLRREAYQAAKLDAQLEEQTRSFLTLSKGLQNRGSLLRVSRIFDWYEEDFDSRGGVESFIRHYRPELEFDEADASLPYNWALNSRQ